MSKKIILRASAGTGKTYRLSLEYIAALLRGESYKNILVMTFTKKATSEIEERIVDFLSILNSNSAEHSAVKERSELISSLEALYPELAIDSEKIKKSYEEICKNRDRLRIYTIDGFINRIFKTVIAPSLGLESYALIDSDEEIEIIYRLLEKIFSKKESFNIFKNFLSNNMEKNLDSYITIIKTLLDQRWKYILLKEAQNSENIKTKTELSYSLDSRTLVSILDEIMELMSEVAKIKNNSKKTDNPPKYFLTTWSSPYAELESSSVKENFIRENSLSILDLSKNFWNGSKVRGKDIADIIEELNEAQESLRDKVRVDLYNSDILGYERDVLNFIDELYRNYDEIKLKEGNLTFNDVSTYTYINYANRELNLLKDGEITSYFEQLFDGEIKTFFIDEFQDTSILQWKLLSAIAQKAKTVFCVGDEKQSLYSWRGGEKELFEKLPDILDGESQNLDICYRSRKNIVEFTNTLFLEISKLYGYEKDIFDSSWNFAPVNFIKNDESYIEIMDSHNYISENNYDSESLLEDDEEKKIAQNLHLDMIVSKLKNDFHGDYRDVAIIGRTAAELSEMATRLANEHIPFTIKSNKSLFEHRANISTYRLLKFMAYDDYLSLLEFLRGDLIELGNLDLKLLIHEREAISDYIKNGNINETFLLDMSSSEKFLKILEKLHNIYALYKKNIENIETVIVEIFKSFGVLSLYDSSSDIKNYYRFLEICKEFKNIHEFIKTSESNPNNPVFSQVSVENREAVTLITIHSSKGLEYDTVFFIHNPKRAGNSDSNLRFYLELDENFSNMKDFLILNKTSEKIIKSSEDSPHFLRYDFIKKIAYKELQEKINGWYVALTRAKRNLFIVLGSKTEDILKSALNICPDKVGTFDRNFESSASDNSRSESELPKDMILDFFPHTLKDEILEENFKLQLETLRTGFQDRERRRIIGTAVHFFLENIKYLTENEISRAKEMTLSQYGGELGIDTLETLFSSREFLDTLKENNEIFSEKWDHIYSEFQVKLDNEIKRIDRIMIKRHSQNSKGEILIVDYKTGAWDEAQIEGYKKAVLHMLDSDNLTEFYEIRTKFMSINLPKEIFYETE